jgi:hypothetical protein
MQIARRSLFGLAAMFVLTFGSAALLPSPAFACSCAQITIGALDPTQNQVYIATAGQASPQGMPMAVERWFTGPGAAPVVTLGPASFGDSAGCGTEPFAPGSRWIVSAWAGDPAQAPTTGLCQPHALLDSPEGQAMLTEAVSAYGDGSVPEGGGAGPTATPEPSAPSAPTDPSTTVILAGVIGLGVVGLGLVYVLGRNRTKAG